MPEALQARAQQGRSPQGDGKLRRELVPRASEPSRLVCDCLWRLSCRHLSSPSREANSG
jgi:hypothetical protein